MSKTREERKRSKYRLAFDLAVCAWLAVIIYVLFVGGKPEPIEPPEPIVIVAAESVSVPEPITIVEPVMEAEPELDLSKLPMIENATLTHYCICQKCCGKTPEHPAYGITASGREAEPYVSVAVDPFMIELGSTVYIDYGDGVIHEYRADDTGSAVSGAKIDLCVTTHQEALELGVKTVRVWWEE